MESFLGNKIPKPKSDTKNIIKLQSQIQRTNSASSITTRIKYILLVLNYLKIFESFFFFFKKVEIFEGLPFSYCSMKGQGQGKNHCPFSYF